MRNVRYLLVALVVALVTTGCIRSDLTVAVNDDGSGTYTAIVAFNPKAFADLAKTMGETDTGMGDDPCKELRDSANENKADLPTGAKIENYTDGDFCGVKITAPFKAGENPARALEEALGSASDGAEGLAVGLDTFTLEKTGSGWRFEAQPQNSGSGSSGSDSAMFDSFLKGASSIVRIKLPGRMVEKDSNPDAVDSSGTMIWNLNLAGETRTLKARTEPGSPITNKTYTDAGKKLPNIKGAGVAGAGSSGSGSGDSGSSTLPLVIGAVVVIAAIVGFVLWRKSKSKGAPVPAAPPVGGAAAAPMSGAPTMPTVPGAPAEAAPMWAAPAAPAAAPTPSAPVVPTVPAPAVDPTATMPVAAPAPSAAPEPTAPTTPVEPAAAAAGPGEPQWDPARNAYILWDAGSSKWLQYDNAAGAWKPID
jgi:hypothetical protein